MGRYGGRHDGGILDLIRLVEEEDAQSEFEYDLIQAGVRLRWVGDGTDRLSWRDLLVLVRHMDGTAALAQKLSEGDSQWDFKTHLLASVVDGVHAMIWQNGGGKGQRPKPLPRPGQATARSAETSSNTKNSVPQGNPFKDEESGVFKGEMTPLSELNKWLGWVDD